jgi:glycosyltransferase involved in cell wall biosynthesis
VETAGVGTYFDIVFRARRMSVKSQVELNTEAKANEWPRWLGSESVLVSMYSLPEAPTFNAILMLKKCFGRVVFLRNNYTCPPDYYVDPPELEEVGSPCDIRTAEGRNLLWKLGRFTRYALALRRELASGQYRLVILHDYLALLAFGLVRKMAGFEGLAWFNSYDAIDLDHFRPSRFTLMGQVVARLEVLFAELDFFSLPTEERKRYYPLHRVKRETFVIPNYSAMAHCEPFQRPRRLEAEPVIRLIYQGSLVRGHGYEEIIRALAAPVAGRRVEFILKGRIREDYRRELEALAAQSGMGERLIFPGFVPYPKLPEQAASGTIGLAIYTGKDIMNRTPGTASNKIYEYIAAGLPVILLDTPYFRKYFGAREWAFFTDLSESSMRETIAEILSRYEEAANAAMEDFKREFTYESVFNPALCRVVEVLSRFRHDRSQ